MSGGTLSSCQGRREGLRTLRRNEAKTEKPLRARAVEKITDIHLFLRKVRKPHSGADFLKRRARLDGGLMAFEDGGHTLKL